MKTDMPGKTTVIGTDDKMVKTTGRAQVVTEIAPAAGAKMTLAEVRTKLEGKTGKRFWKSLDEISAKPGFRQMLEEEFPRQAGEWVDAVSRRGFLKVMGASLDGRHGRMHQAAR